MKKLIYILCGLCTLWGCSLKEEVVSNSTRDTYYKNEIQVRTGLNGCYTNARSILCNSAFWQMTECTTDLISMSLSSQYNANCDVSPSRPGVSTTGRYSSSRRGLILGRSCWAKRFRIAISVNRFRPLIW